MTAEYFVIEAYKCYLITVLDGFFRIKHIYIKKIVIKITKYLNVE